MSTPLPWLVQSFLCVSTWVAPAEPIDLSLTQEAEAAIDRACLWLTQHPATDTSPDRIVPPPAASHVTTNTTTHVVTDAPRHVTTGAMPSVPTNIAARVWLYHYAQSTNATEVLPTTIARPVQTFLGHDQDLAPFVIPQWQDDGPLLTTTHTNQALFRLQAQLATLQNIPPDAPFVDWRTQLTQRLINTQTISGRTGHWGSAAETLYGILALRSLLQQSTPIESE